MIKPNQAREFLRKLFDVSVAAADPLHCIPPYLQEIEAKKLIVIGAGKASAAMARAVEQHWFGELEGLIVTRYDHAVPTQHIEIVEASHPVPDEAGMKAAERILEIAQQAGPDDHVLCLISGGGSALLSLPVDAIDFAEKQDINKQLLTSGASISEMNCVRKHFSKVKGGRLAAAAYPAALTTLAISDVPGDDLSIIASGPTVPDSSTRFDALNIINKYDISVSDSAINWLNCPESETPKADDVVFSTTTTKLVATPMMSLEAAKKLVLDNGMTPLVLSDELEGEAREVGKVHASIARHILKHSTPVKPPAVILSGGETTVTVRHKGRGGRNTEFLLGYVLQSQGDERTFAIACDTDGIDGSEDNAGAIATPDTLSRAQALNVKAEDYLQNNDAYSFFEILDDLVVSGPTLTNVNDFRAVLILDEQP